MTSKQVRKTLSMSRLDSAPFYPTIADVKRWSELLNFVMFDGRVPKWRTITVRRMRAFGTCEGHHGKRTRYCTLEIRDKFESFAAFYAILAHELCHVLEFCEEGTMNHGRYFFSHRETLNNFGMRLQSKY